VKRYVVEPDRAEALRLPAADTSRFTAAHTEVEVRRTLTIRLAGDAAALRHARLASAEDWRRLVVVQLDVTTCRIAAELSELTRARRIDALHLAAVQRVGAPRFAC
jgi:predicted nucleic acid-binding protein